MTNEKSLNTGQFEFTGEMASLQARQAAAFGYIKGYMQEAFRCKEGLGWKDMEWLEKRVFEQFGLRLQAESSTQGE